MMKDKYKEGENISQKLFEMTGDPRYHNARVGFEKLRKEKETVKKTENNREIEREM